MRFPQETLKLSMVVEINAPSSPDFAENARVAQPKRQFELPLVGLHRKRRSRKS